MFSPCLSEGLSFPQRTARFFDGNVSFFFFLSWSGDDARGPTPFPPVFFLPDSSSPHQDTFPAERICPSLAPPKAPDI